MMGDGMGMEQEPRMPLFMIHGNGVDHQILKPLESQLRIDGVFDCVFLDLPGFGTCQALPDPAGLPELADWLENAIRTIAEDVPFALLGNSLGGLFCQEMADRFAAQVQGMFLLAPVVFPDASQRTLPDREVAVSDVGLLERIGPRNAQLFSEAAVLQTAEAWSAFSKWVLPGLQRANLRAMAKLSKRYFLDPLPVDRESTVDIPVTVVCGKQDHITGYLDQQQLSRRYPLARLRVLETAGHNVHIEQPAQVAAEVRTWSREVALRRTSG